MLYKIPVLTETKPTLTATDEAFALFCEQAIVALTFFALMSQPAEQRLYTGYMNKAQRDAAAHGLYDLGIRTPAARETAADKALAEAQRWGLAS